MAGSGPTTNRLAPAFYARDPATVARALLGQVVWSKTDKGITAGRIVETEAYLGADDPASHAITRRHAAPPVMRGEPGVAYVYRCYGIHAMLNAVAHEVGGIGAVLIRALEPMAGLDLMAQRRGLATPRLLCAGPGRLCQALGIRLQDHGLNLATSERLWITAAEPIHEVSRGSRIGISAGVDLPLRYFARGSLFVSAHRRGEVNDLKPTPIPGDDDG